MGSLLALPCSPGGGIFSVMARCEGAVVGWIAHGRTSESATDASGSGSDAYNNENCQQAQTLFQQQPAVIVKFWCEKGGAGVPAIAFNTESATEVTGMDRSVSRRCFRGCGRRGTRRLDTHRD